jgi:hypothetical protein
MHPASVTIHCVLSVLCIVLMFLPAHAQQEADLADADAGSGYSVIGLHRAWQPDEGYRPNTGLYFDVLGRQSDSPMAVSFMGLFTGVGERNIAAIMAGPHYTFVGSPTFGLFAAANLGFTVGSKTGTLAFDVFTDPTLTVGFAGIVRLGGTIPITRDVLLSLSAAQSWFSNERGATPPAVQVGLSLGGGQ